MKIKALLLAVLITVSLWGCSAPTEGGGVAATTLPVYQFTSILCEGTDIPVTRLVTESVSCLHDYSLKVSQVKAVEKADVVVITGAGLEDFLSDILGSKAVLDASEGIVLLEGCHAEGHEGHHHAEDPHLWLSPAYAARMAENICAGLTVQYPAHADSFAHNLQILLADLAALQTYGDEALASLSCRELVTFHDGFTYFANAFDLEILEAVEEEAGSEASARDLIDLITLVQVHRLPAIFTEENGSVSAANVIAAETGAKICTLSMAMAGDDYFAAMYRNIDTIREALG